MGGDLLDRRGVSAVSRRGLSLVEMLVAITVFGVVAGVVCRVLYVTMRAFTAQIQQAEVNHTLRSAAVILWEELRELDAGDPRGGDIVAMSRSSLTYKGARGLYSLCRPPDSESGSMTLYAWLDSDVLKPAMDSLLVFAAGSAGAGYWLRLDVVGVSLGRQCPGGSASMTVRVRSPDVSLLSEVDVGAPARALQVFQLRRYADSRGVWWLGMRRVHKADGRWPNLQPVLGPLAASGLEFRYYDRAGRPTELPGSVSSIAINVSAAASGRALSMADDAPKPGTRLEFRVVLRNNPRP
jgi:prepilin-type N-terminal cleavage/methylation domain-containing protein